MLVLRLDLLVHGPLLHGIGRVGEIVFDCGSVRLVFSQRDLAIRVAIPRRSLPDQAGALRPGAIPMLVSW